MPLKTDDLKTVENYKKAIKNDLSKLSASRNTKFWVYKDIELPTASGSKQKLPALISLVDDVAVKAVLKGKQPLCHGTCGIEQGMISFEASQGTIPYGILTKSVPLLLGKMVHVPAGADVDAAGSEQKAPAGPPPPPPAGTASTPGHYAQLNAAWKQLSEQASKRVAAHPAEQAAFAEVMKGIPEMLSGGQLNDAQKRLERLQSALKAPPPAPPQPGSARPAAAGAAAPAPQGTAYPGIVKYRRSLVEFAQAKSVVHAQIANLKSAILKAAPHEGALAEQMTKELLKLNNELAATVDEAMKDAENQASPASDIVKAQIYKYISHLSSNALVKRADTNPLGVPVTIQKTLGEALARIREAMPD